MAVLMHFCLKKKTKERSAYEPNGYHATSYHAGFCSMQRLGAFLLPSPLPGCPEPRNETGALIPCIFSVQSSHKIMTEYLRLYA